MNQTHGARGANGSGVRFDCAECDTRERRFTSAVFTDERVYLAWAHVEIDPVDGNDAGIRFADRAQL